MQVDCLLLSCLHGYPAILQLVYLDNLDGYALPFVTTQDFINFWGKIFVFVLLEMFGNSQGFKTF
jgi:hypothetical protein